MGSEKKYVAFNFGVFTGVCAPAATMKKAIRKGERKFRSYSSSGGSSIIHRVEEFCVAEVVGGIVVRVYKTNPVRESTAGGAVPRGMRLDALLDELARMQEA